MKELLLKIKNETVLEIKKDDSPIEYRDAKSLIKQGYLIKLSSYEEIEAIVVRVSQKGNDYLKKS